MTTPDEVARDDGPRQRPRFFAPRFWLGATLASFGAWSAFGLLFAGFQYFDLKRTGNPQPWSLVLANAAPFWLAWSLASPFALRWAQRWPVTRRGLWRVLGIQAAGCGLTLALVLTIMLLAIGLLDARRWDDWSALLSQLAFFAIAPGVLIYAVNVAVGSSLEYARRLQDQTLRAARADAALSRARLDALLHQLRPHFVFNTLHAIASLVRKDDSRAAIEMITRLGELLRRTLRCTPDSRVPLSEELDLLEQYLDIEKVRLGERLQIHIDVEPDTRDARVPVLLLLPIAENAVRHGIAPVRRPCQLRIHVSLVDGERLRLTIENDGAPLEPGVDARSGVGLANTRQRLETLYGKAFRLELRAARPGACTTIEIPWEPAEEGR